MANKTTTTTTTTKKTAGEKASMADQKKTLASAKKSADKAAAAMAAKAPKQKSDAKDILTLEGVKAIRKRPGMYVGGIGPKAVFRMFVEGLGNVLDLFAEGAAKNVFINVNEKTKEITITDDAYGMPIEKIDAIMTVPHTSGKFENNGFSIGMNGVGNKAINALSERTVVIVKRDGYKWRRTFEKGDPVGDLERLDKLTKSDGTGTTIIFKPDLKHLNDDTIPIDDYIDSLAYLEFVEKVSYLNPGLKITYHATPKKGGEVNKVLLSKNGLVDYLSSVLKTPLIKSPIYISDTGSGDNEIRIAMNYNADPAAEVEEIHSYVNGMSTTQHGTHVQGFKMAVTEVIKKYIAENNMITKKEGKIEITGDDVREAIVVAMELKWIEPLFDSQTKDCLTTSAAMGYVKKVVTDQLSQWLVRNKNDAKTICNRVILAAKGRMAAKRSKASVRGKESGFASISSLSKYTRCSSSDPTRCEYYLVEGDSAGGTASQGRDPETQSIYRLRGKPLNTHDHEILKVKANKEFNDIINTLGCGTGKEFDESKLTHHKIVIMTDADVDGEHIRSLLLTFFWKHTPQLILKGYVYVAQPPLYRAKINGKERYIKNLEEYNHLLDEMVVSRFTVGRVIDKKPVAMDDSEVRDLINGTRRYNTRLENLQFRGDKELLEFVAMNRKKKPEVMAALISRKFPEAETSVTDAGVFVNGMVNGTYQSLLINDTLFGELGQVVEILDRFNISTMFVKKENGKSRVTSLSRFLEESYNDVTPKDIQRYKGLGEMNPSQLWETTMDPARRTLVRVTVGDEENADALFEMHMGKNADARKVFIQGYECDPENLG